MLTCYIGTLSGLLGLVPFLDYYVEAEDNVPQVLKKRAAAKLLAQPD